MTASNRKPEKQRSRDAVHHHDIRCFIGVRPINGLPCPSSVFALKFSASVQLSLHINLLQDLGDFWSGGRVSEQAVSLPYEAPMSPGLSLFDENQTFYIQERGMSWTGEDFDVRFDDNQHFLKVRGAIWHLPGKDKMRLFSTTSETKEEVAVLDRKMVALTPTYDIYYAGGNSDKAKLGWIEQNKVALVMGKSFDVYLASDIKGGLMGAVWKPSPVFSITGDFFEKSFVMKNAQDQIVAKGSKDGVQWNDAINRYKVQVAPGMDAILVVACLVAIDEELDEEHQEKRKQEQRER